MAKIAIDQDQTLTRGDVIEIHFASLGMNWIKATQIVLLEQKLQGREDWTVLNYQTPVDQPSTLIMTVKVIGGPRPEGETPGATGGWLVPMQMGLAPVAVPVAYAIKAAAIIAVIVSAGIMYRLTVQEVFLVTAENIRDVFGSPEGKIAVAGTGVGIAAAGVAALLYLFMRK